MTAADIVVLALIAVGAPINAIYMILRARGDL